MSDHDFGFSDDELDSLPVDAFVELETNAIQFTQVHTQTRYSKTAAAVKAAPSSDYGDEIGEEDLDDAVIIDESRSTPAIIQGLQRSVPSQAVQREHFRQQRYGTIANPQPHLADRRGSRPTPPPPPRFSQTNQLPQRAQIPQHDSMRAEHGSQPSVTGDNAADKMRRQFQELLKERDALKSEVNAKSGEIAIVRSKNDQVVKEAQRKEEALNKLHADKEAKWKREIESTRIAEKNAATERDFVKQDLAEEAERVRRLRRAQEAEKGASVTTPKKKKPLPHRDGFDDDEVEMLSPSKISPSRFQRRLAGSPSKPGAKRKRKTVESPVGALEVTNAEEPVVEKPLHQDLILDDSIIESLGKQDDRFDFIGTMLDHRVSLDHARTIQELEKYALPSSPDESFQSILLGKIPTLGSKRPQKDLPVDFCELLISMWSNCVAEKYYTPIYLFIDMLTLALELKTTAVGPHITDTIVPLAQLTADIIIIPRFQTKPTNGHEKDINVSACLAILHIVALGCMSEQQHIIRFWKLMRFDFVLVMLSTNHPIPEFEMMLRILSTSVFRDSFGPFMGDSVQSTQVVNNILVRLTYPMSEVPFLPGSPEKMDLSVLAKLRFKVIQLMTSMTRSPFASKAMAMHPLVIGRLVGLISDEIDDLYDYKARHEESARIISLTMRLLYYIVTKFDDDIDMQKKLAAIRGGSQKYLLCLSRLNFSEDDLVLESGIEPDVAGCALELLELFVTPEEGDAIHSAFSGS
ncbi:hypothetical protein LHYA1_G006276 [Lachnellula hyalina]|uniref:DNA repair protein Rad26 n=1 Tax=Lachnellula hyalina TaxID=1316788 RepID=A0A8H8QYU0_9HELO|nr:uncharacterized protein LHYA1_G006276 [Lachnellula hyalina]TVY24546.1 hypothetical protein LHYA1_G006276 [Lachnellula hyalina]